MHMVSRFQSIARKGAHARAAARAGAGTSRGFTAVEFAIVAMPFLLLLFGIISVCLYFFTNFTIENASWQAARAIRTGQLQQAQGAYAGMTTNEDRTKAFKKALCDKAPDLPRL